MFYKLYIVLLLFVFYLIIVCIPSFKSLWKVFLRFCPLPTICLSCYLLTWNIILSLLLFVRCLNPWNYEKDTSYLDRSCIVFYCRADCLCL